MLWTPLGYDRYRESSTVNKGESTMAQQMIIGIDLAKHVFQVCMVTPQGALKTNTTGARGKLLTLIAQFLALCSRSKWSKNFTNSPFLALLAIAGSKAAYKIISACSNAVS